MSSLLQDVRFAFRLLWKQPVFTLAVALTLAVGIGANTALFSVVYSVLLHPLPYERSERLVAIAETNGTRTGSVAPLNFLDWRTRSSSFEAMAAEDSTPLTLNDGDRSERVVGFRASADFFKVLHARPLYGRVFTADDDRYGAARVAVISFELWRRVFGADPSVVGRNVRFDSTPVTIVGVLSEGLAYPAKTDVFVPLALAPDETDSGSRGAHYLTVVARLKDGVTLEQASAEMDGIARVMSREYAKTNANAGVVITPLLTWIVGATRPALMLLFTAVGLVLLIACVNVSHLMLTRASARRGELAIRTALGAARLSLLRQLLIESMTLSLVGAAGGIALAWWGLDLLVAVAPPDLPRLDEVAVNRTVLAFTFGLSVATGLLFGLVPALQALREDGVGALTGLRHERGEVRGRSTRGILVACEVALAVMLLVAAALTASSFARLTQVRLGFSPDRVLTFRVALPPARYPDPAAVGRFFQRLTNDLGSQPGVESAAVSMILPLEPGGFGGTFSVAGQPALPENDEPIAQVRAISSGYFRTMSIPLIGGRSIADTDEIDARPVAVVSESVARQYWPGRNPIGRILRLHVGVAGPEREREIVGVVADVTRRQIGSGPAPIIYVPHLQYAADEMAIVVKVAGQSEATIPMLRSRLQTLDRELAASGLEPLERHVTASLAPARFRSILLTAFAVVALGLAVLGLYGVMSYSVAERTHEIGLRMALGAGRREVIRLFLGQGMLPVACGLAAGLIGAVGTTRIISSLLFGVSAYDPVTYGAVSLVLALSASLGCYVPVRRALRMDPLTALREE